MYNTSTVRPLGKCKVQLTNSRDRRKYKHNLTIVEDEHCANLIVSKTAQQMQLITIRNDKIKPCPQPAECSSTAIVDVSKAKIFTEVDCKNCYWQIELTEETLRLTTFATFFDRCKWNRMPFGISPVSEIYVFQLGLHEAVKCLDGVYAMT